MSFKIKGMEARRLRNLRKRKFQTAARERARQARESEPIPDLPITKPGPPDAVVRISIQGMPSKSIEIRRLPNGKITALGKLTTPKQLGRTIGTLLDQFL